MMIVKLAEIDDVSVRGRRKLARRGAGEEREELYIRYLILTRHTLMTYTLY